MPIFSQLNGAKYFSTLDLRAGYHHIGLTADSIPKTAFTSPFGKYEYVRVPFGLAQAPAYFQELMTGVLEDLPFAMAYLDDIIIYSSTPEEHLQHLKTVFKKLCHAKLSMKLNTQWRWSTPEQEAYGIYFAIKKWNYYLQGADIIVRNDHKPLAWFLNRKNKNTKISRWGLELASCNITFNWISGAKNKAADCLLQLVELPTKHQKNPNRTKPTLINMVKAVTTRSGMRKTPAVKETKKQPPLETNLNKDNPKDTSIKEMQSTDPFCKCIMKSLLNKTAPKHELNTFFIHNGLLYRYASDHSKDFCALVIPKTWRYTILVETHDKMGHQGNNRMYSLIKQQYYWKGMAKDVKDYIQQCPAC